MKINAALGFPTPPTTLPTAQHENVGASQALGEFQALLTGSPQVPPNRDGSSQETGLPFQPYGMPYVPYAGMPYGPYGGCRSGHTGCSMECHPMLMSNNRLMQIEEVYRDHTPQIIMRRALRIVRVVVAVRVIAGCEW